MMASALRQAQPAACLVFTFFIAERPLEYEQFGAVLVRHSARIRTRLPALEPHRVGVAWLRIQRLQADTRTGARLPLEPGGVDCHVLPVPARKLPEFYEQQAPVL